MQEEEKVKELSELLQRKQWLRAAKLASELGRPQEEIRDYHEKALWQMAAVNRNGPGTKTLASELGLGKQETTEILTRLLKINEKARELDPCYDHLSTQYLDFSQWMVHLERRWERL